MADRGSGKGSSFLKRDRGGGGGGGGGARKNGNSDISMGGIRSLIGNYDTNGTKSVLSVRSFDYSKEITFKRI